MLSKRFYSSAIQITITPKTNENRAILVALRAI